MTTRQRQIAYLEAADRAEAKVRDEVVQRYRGWMDEIVSRLVDEPDEDRWPRLLGRLGKRLALHLERIDNG